MAACTHDGLLYGGPDYFAHGDLPCIHHTFAHAKALATVLDSGVSRLEPAPRLTLPRDEPYGVKRYPEIGTYLAAIGPWQATVTEYDWEYVEHVQSGGGGAGGGHVSGGALSLLYHCAIGPVFAASMTEYQMIEISNQQMFGEYPHMPLTPRIEYAGDKTYTSMSDFAAVLTSSSDSTQITFDARGRLLTAAHQTPPQGDVHYRLLYRLTESTVEITAWIDGNTNGADAVSLIVPVIARADEGVDQIDAKTVRITKSRGVLHVRADAPHGFKAIPKERTFNLIPGFECVPLELTMQLGEEIRIQLAI